MVFRDMNTINTCLKKHICRNWPYQNIIRTARILYSNRSKHLYCWCSHLHTINTIIRRKRLSLLRQQQYVLSIVKIFILQTYLNYYQKYTDPCLFQGNLIILQPFFVRAERTKYYYSSPLSSLLFTCRPTNSNVKKSSQPGISFHATNSMVWGVYIHGTCVTQKLHYSHKQSCVPYFTVTFLVYICLLYAVLICSKVLTLLTLTCTICGVLLLKCMAAVTFLTSE
jgi:hypothetical protein